jgi:hypothetical protein
MFKFEKKIIVEGHGEYNIEVTNVINPKTMQI